VDEVRGAASDTGGRPLAGLGASVCGRLCYGATTDASGAYRVKIGAVIDLSRYVVHLDGRPDHADVLARLADPAVPTLRAPALPDTGAPLPPDGAGGRVAAGPLAIDVPQGATFALAFADATAGDRGRMLRVTKVALEDAPPFAASVAALYAMAPSGAESSAKLALTIANDANLAAGAPVEILTLEDDAIASPLEAGTLRAIARAHVSADARTIATDPGEGITKLNWLGVREGG
jgi:hypothetical protein